MPSRRHLLKQASLVSLAPTIPGFLKSTSLAAMRDREKILVVVELGGGNDGLNTLVPFQDDGYLGARKELRLEEATLIKLTDSLALHSSMRGMGKLFQDGELAIVQGVGYPNSNRSHDVSMAVWHTARMDPEQHRDVGWLGRSMDLVSSRPSVPSAVCTLAGSVPNAVLGRRSKTASIESLNDFAQANLFPQGSAASAQSDALVQSAPSGMPLSSFLRQSALEAYATSEQLRALSETRRSRSSSALSRLDSPLASQLNVIADLIQADFGSRVYYAVQSGYDTHSRQLNEHSGLLASLSSSVSGFLHDVEASGNADRVLLMCFSEFGRQVHENASAGTDHGTAGPMFLASKGVRGGIYGKPLDLRTLVDNAPQHNTDFRDVYAGVLRDWLGLDPKRVLDGHVEVLSVV
jgi:uncharacterized protein (DUF1501 family)